MDEAAFEGADQGAGQGGGRRRAALDGWLVAGVGMSLAAHAAVAALMLWLPREPMPREIASVALTVEVEAMAGPEPGAAAAAGDPAPSTPSEPQSLAALPDPAPDMASTPPPEPDMAAPPQPVQPPAAPPPTPESAPVPAELPPKPLLPPPVARPSPPAPQAARAAARPRPPAGPKPAAPPLADTAAGQQAAGPPQSGTTASAAVIPSTAPGPAWQRLIEAWLAMPRPYPWTARLMGVQGTVRVRFSLDRGGHVLEAAIVDGSGSDVLDRDALALLHDAHLPPSPDPADPPIARYVFAKRYRLTQR